MTRLNASHTSSEAPCAHFDERETPGMLRGFRHVVRLPGIWVIVVIGFSGFLASHDYRSWRPEMLADKGLMQRRQSSSQQFPRYAVSQAVL